jgi:hypothetical protein
MPANMKKIETYLKKLAEKRARAAGDVERYSKAAEQSAALLAKAQSVLGACDVLIAEYDERLDPSVIESIKTWHNHPKKRGDLKATLVDILKAASPKWLTTDEICDEVEARWKLEFIIPADRVEWKRGSIGRQLRRHASSGLIETSHDRGVAATVVAGLWRWKMGPAPSLDRLKAKLEDAGQVVHRSDASRG